MRVAIVTETYAPEINGVALTVQSFVEHLRALGHEVLLARPRQRGEPALRLRAPVRDGEDLLTRGADLPRYPGLRFGFPAGARLRRAWRAWRPDAVYVATEGPLGWSALRAARVLRIPCVTGFHTRFDDFAAHYGLGWLTGSIFAWMRRFHNRADATLVPTEELRGFLARSGFHSVRVLRRAVDTVLFSPARRDPSLRAQWGLTTNELAVIFVGRIAPEKNLSLVISAFDALRAHVPAARLIWVGDGPELSALQRERPDFVYCGVRRGTDLARHFASADLFLFPSLTETFGNVTLEAMASGVPVVAFDYGAAREHRVDGDSGRAVRMGDAAAFSAAACALATDASARARMARAGRAAVERLSPTAVASALVDILRAPRANSGDAPCAAPRSIG